MGSSRVGEAQHAPEQVVSFEFKKEKGKLTIIERKICLVLCSQLLHFLPDVLAPILLMPQPLWMSPSHVLVVVSDPFSQGHNAHAGGYTRVQFSLLTMKLLLFWVTMLHTFNPSTPKAEAGGLPVLWDYPGPHSETGVSLGYRGRSCLVGPVVSPPHPCRLCGRQGHGHLAGTPWLTLYTRSTQPSSRSLSGWLVHCSVCPSRLVWACCWVPF